MTDTETSTEQTAPAPSARQLATARAFLAKHGKPAKAVVNRIGRGGARVVLIGTDGLVGDIVVPSVETGHALIEAVAGLEDTGWDADTVGATEIGPAHWRKMAGPYARR